MDDSSSFACGVNRASRTNKTLYSLPVHCLTQTDLQLENAKGIMQHFHAPANSHNRFLASLTQQERAILRDFERPPPYNSTGTHDAWTSSALPGPAPCQATGHSTSKSTSTKPQQPHSRRHQPASASGLHGAQHSITATQKGVPCHSKSVMVDVDLLTGQPASPHICSTQPWRVARVKSHRVPHSSYAYAEGGKRARHQTYEFYKYYGFAGQGAKTSWASSASKQPAKALQAAS